MIGQWGIGHNCFGFSIELYEESSRFRADQQENGNIELGKGLLIAHLVYRPPTHNKHRYVRLL